MIINTDFFDEFFLAVTFDCFSQIIFISKSDICKNLVLQMKQ